MGVVASRERLCSSLKSSRYLGSISGVDSVGSSPKSERCREGFSGSGVACGEGSASSRCAFFSSVSRSEHLSTS